MYKWLDFGYDFLDMLRFSDSYTKSVRKFVPLEKEKVSMYNCGPTVYSYVHIGNLRYFLCVDFLRRYLEYSGFAVTQIMNITDVGHMLADADEGEDKIEAAAKAAGKTPQEVAEFYTEAFFRDIDRLNVRRATHYPKASEHVQEMIGVIEKLLERGHAYMVGKNVYYDVASFKKYGALSGNVVKGLEAGKRIAVREEKKNPADFALWIHNPAHVMQWEAPWGTGYPGWHIECSAMAGKYLGDTIDIHTGGEDNKFPHHECEIAQSEGASGKQFSRFWLHVSHLLVDGEKMSKSKGNVYRLDDLMEKGYSPAVVRYALLLSAHYRQPMNFTFTVLDAAKASVERLGIFAEAVRGAKTKKGKRMLLANKVGLAIEKALDDDLNVSDALAQLWEYVRAINEMIATDSLTEGEREGALKMIKMIDVVFGVKVGEEVDIPPSVHILVQQREQARTEKRFVEADRVRDELKEQGWIIEDTANGVRVRRV